jgi:predicted transcriptional regulator
MENLYELLFELSNEDRYRILIQLDSEEMTITSLSNTLNLSKQEVSRHISRLSNAKLSQKRTDGSYYLTEYGKLALKQIPGLNFISQHKEYFSTHTLSSIPLEFINRIGDLQNSTYSDDVMVVLYNIEKLIEEAEEYVWEITHEYPGNTYQLETEAYRKGVSLKCIQPEGWVPSPQLEAAVRPEDREAIQKAWIKGLLEVKTLKQLDIFLYMSEKEVAIVGFPNINRKFDYLGFSSKDQQTHKWCLDLCNYYWKNAKTKRRLYF